VPVQGCTLHFFYLVDKLETRILVSITFFFLNCVVHEKKWKYLVELGRPRMTIRFMRIAYWIPKATDTYSEYVINIALGSRY